MPPSSIASRSVDSGRLRKKSGSKRNLSTSRTGSGSSARTSKTPLPPPIIHVGSDGDFDETDKSRGKGFQDGKQGKAYATNGVVARRPSHTKRWSPPPFPSLSSSSTTSLKSDLSSSASISLVKISDEKNLAAPSPRFNLSPSSSSLTHPPPAPPQSLSANPIASSERRETELNLYRWTSASAPNLTSPPRGTKTISPTLGTPEVDSPRPPSSHARSPPSPSLIVGESKEREENDDEEEPFLSLSEMSVAIRRWNHAIKSSATYDDAQRPNLTFHGAATNTVSVERGSRQSRTSRSCVTSSTTSGTRDATIPSPNRKQPRPQQRPHQRPQQQQQPEQQSRSAHVISGKLTTSKKRLKAIPTGGIKSSFFGSQTASSPIGKKIEKDEKSRNKDVGEKEKNEISGGKAAELEWESQLPSEMKKIYRHYKSYDETPRLRRGGKFQDLLLPTKTRRPSMNDINNNNDVDDTNDNKNDDDGETKTTIKMVVFEVESNSDEVERHLSTISARKGPVSVEESCRPLDAISSPPLLADPAALEKSYRRHIARYYARSASKYDQIEDSFFPALPDLPPGATSPFLTNERNRRIWQWLNEDFCKTKLDYFLSLCS